MKNFNEMNREQRIIIILIALCIALSFLIVIMQAKTNSLVEEYNNCAEELNIRIEKEWRQLYNIDDDEYVWQDISICV